MNSVLPDQIIDAIYDAALDRALWPQALSRISQQFRGAPAQISIFDVESGTIPLGIGVEFMDGVWEIAQRFATPETNPMLGIAMRIPLHKAVDQGAEIGIHNFRSLDIHAELYRPQDHMPLLGTVVARSPRSFGGMALMRRSHWPQATAEDLALGERISRHVGRAVALAGLFDVHEPGLDSFEAALHQATTPILLLTTDGQVAWINPAAEEILRTQDGLVVRRRRLMATHPADDARLAAAIAEAAQGAEPVVTVQRTDAAAMLVARLSPLWRTQAATGAQIMVRIIEPSSRLRHDPLEAAEVFKLTPGEARVACEICAGRHNLNEVGRLLRISVNTVKTLLQRVYDKTSVRSQNELAILFCTALQSSRNVPK